MSKTLTASVYSCNECEFNSGQQKVFYDTVQDKVKLKAMLLFQNPGGIVDNETRLDELSRMSPEDVAAIHRDGFEAWPGNYYLYFREICRHLYKKGFIMKFPQKISNDILEEMYVTDAVKCRAKIDADIKKHKNSKGFSSPGVCSQKFLKKEIDSLHNLELIISFGNWANEALDALVKLKGYNGNISILPNGAATRELVNKYNLKPYEGSLKKRYSHGKIYEIQYIYPDGTNRLIKNIHFNHPSWFYNEGPLRNQPGLREKILIHSINWCFSKL